MPSAKNPDSTLLAAWRTNNRVTAELVASLPAALWRARVPQVPTRTVRAIAAHLHNARCMWIRTLGSEQGIAVPSRVDHRRVTQKQVVAALRRSAVAMESLFALAIANGGELPRPKRYVWRNLALDIGHLVTYFIAHEAHHRGQIVMIARQSGNRLPVKTTSALWQWKP